ncbi:uncharacterized protein LOC132625062 [Lycium barbarum]|uniref:uncharacterized protein LOC132625062 n=1 Tax=Lycium barbarum TaxID=112863 RepID=UPI00293F2CE4|nr:uncharacterized protein LOC132625062 [Lycium barbarum]XP_060195820.1 uncharacterized protein LOC132625062 [Lycium barbarum]
MDDSFSVRVDKVFGSLTATSNLTSLWSLTDDEIAKREWDRDAPSRELLDFDSKPCPPHIDGFFAKTLDDDDESAIRSAIGLDSALDHEEEEDEFDKVAVDSEKEKQQPSDRFYMRDVSDYGISADIYDELPLTLQDVKRDPRANHEAAKLRLKEDAEAALREGHLASMPPPHPSKTQGHDDAESPKKLKLKEDSKLPPHSSIPDYIRNPAKYTCYTLDVSDDMDEQSNRKAYMDFLSLMKKQSQLDDDSSTNFQKSPTFNSRMKQPAGTITKHGIEAEQMQVKKTVPRGIVAVESDNAHVSALEEDESSIAADRARPGSLHKSGRRYRTRAIMMDTDD